MPGLKEIIRLNLEKILKISNLTAFIIRIILGIVFLISAYSKLKVPQEFAVAVENYRIFGNYLSRWGAVFIPSLELILAIFLILGIWKKETILITAVLFIVFDLMIFQAYLRGLDISCGCFSSTEFSPINLWKFVENSMLTVLAFLGLFLQFRKSHSNII